MIHMAGLNYRTAGLDVRSRAALSVDQIDGFLAAVVDAGAAECAVVSTCNRTEVYFVGDVTEAVVALMARHAGMSEDFLRDHLYIKNGVCAVCHLFQVAAGLDSAVLGETEIVSQVKQGWTAAVAGGVNGPVIDLIFKRALETSKRIRTETELCRNATSVGSLAVREAEARVGGLDRKRILVLGSGQIAERVGKELRAIGAQHVTFLNRSPERARHLAERLGFAWGPLTSIVEHVLESDVLFATTSAPHPIVTQQDIEGLLVTRRQRPLVAVDLGVPHNVQPDISVEGLTLVNMDTLISKCVINHERRTAAIPAALAILYDELDRVRLKLVERQAASTIKTLVQHGDAVREQTLAWALHKMPNLDDKQRRVVEDLARRLVLGVLTPPIEALKRGDLSDVGRDAIEALYEQGGDPLGA